MAVFDGLCVKFGLENLPLLPPAQLWWPQFTSVSLLWGLPLFPAEVTFKPDRLLEAIFMSSLSSFHSSFAISTGFACLSISISDVSRSHAASSGPN